MSDPAICITVNLSFLPDQADLACEQLSTMVADTRSYPGFVSLEIVRHIDDPARVLFVEHWNDLASYHSYIAWRTERGEMAALAAQLATPPEINFWPVKVV